MDQAEIRALALKTITGRYQSEHQSTDELLNEAERIARWLETGSRLSPEEIFRQDVGKTMRVMAQAETPRQFGHIRRPVVPPELDKPDAELCEQDIVQRSAIIHEQELFDAAVEQPGEIVEPPHMSHNREELPF